MTLKIQGLKPCLVENMPHVWICWIGVTLGVYTVKSAYAKLLGVLGSGGNVGRWAWIWKLHVPANIQFFMWQFYKLALPIRSILVERHVITDPLCPRCLVEVETFYHCLFGYQFVQKVWRNCGIHIPLPSVSAYTRLWTREAIGRWGIMIPILLWVVWTARNKLLFEAKDGSVWELIVQAQSLWTYHASIWQRGLCIANNFISSYGFLVEAKYGQQLHLFLWILG
ncbi:hypothetical protein CR513_31059, partial [Mucuna pruriens]